MKSHQSEALGGKSVVWFKQALKTRRGRKFEKKAKMFELNINIHEVFMWNII